MAGKTLAELARSRRRGRAAPRLGQGGRVPVRQVRGRRHDPRPRDALDRRGHGHRLRLRARVREEPARRRHEAADRAASRSCRCARPTSPRSSRSRAGSSTSASRSSRPTAPPRSCARPASPVRGINKVLEGRPHCVDAMDNHEIDFVINTTEGAQAIQDSQSLRRAALMNGIAYYTTLRGGPRRARGDRGREARRHARAAAAGVWRRVDVIASHASRPRCDKLYG